MFRLELTTILALALVVQSPPRTRDVRVLPGSPAPVYPAGIENTERMVRAEIRVAADGTVAGVTFPKVKDGPFVDAARSALSRWTFAPALKDGRPSESTYETDLFFTPPKGLPIQLGVTPKLRRRLGFAGPVLTIEPGKDRFASVLSFLDVTVRGQMRVPDRARVQLGVRTAPFSQSNRGGYWINLGNTLKDESLAGLLSPGDENVRLEASDANAARAFTSSAHDWQSFEILCAEH
jgi:hypothetical protein